MLQEMRNSATLRHGVVPVLRFFIIAGNCRNQLGKTLEYSVLDALFHGLPIAIAFLLVLHFFRRRAIRLGHLHKGHDPIAVRDVNRQILSVLIPITVLKILVAIMIDDRWDDFRHAFEIPVRSMDGLLLVGFANVGVFASILCTGICIIEIHDRQRSGQRA